MNLIFLYGPPAVGKLTVAKQLQKKLGYKLLHNHMIINMLAEIFGYDGPERRTLVREFRLRILEEAAKDNIDMIITVGNAGNAIFDYFDTLLASVEVNGGTVYLIQLTADKKTLLNRVESATRKEHGKYFGKDILEKTLATYPDMFDKYSKKEHLTINTAETQPEEAVEKIMTYYRLVRAST